MPSLDQCGATDHGNRQEKAELRRGHGIESTPQRRADGRPGSGNAADHRRHCLRATDAERDRDTGLAFDSRKAARGPVHEARDDERETDVDQRRRRFLDLSMKQHTDNAGGRGREREQP